MGFHEEGGNELLYDLPLTKDSVCVDFGTYVGGWSIEVAKRYGCNVFAFEPVAANADEARKRIAPYPTIRLFRIGVWKESGCMGIGVKNDCSGLFTDATKECGIFVDVCDVLHALPPVDVLMMNIEGAEYEVLVRMMDMDMTRIKRLAIQFHNLVPNADARMKAIQDRLSETHRLEWCFPFCWEMWRVKQLDTVPQA